MLSNEAAEYQRGDGRQLDEDINGWARCVFKRITDGVTDDGSLVLFRRLPILVLLLEKEGCSFFLL